MTVADERDEQLVHAYLDGELDVATALSVERKIADDPQLQKLASDVQLLKTAIAETFLSEPFPPKLRRQIEFGRLDASAPLGPARARVGRVRPDRSLAIERNDDDPFAEHWTNKQKPRAC